MIKRAEYAELMKRLKEPRRFIQVILGPRQVGKTTLIEQVLSAIDLPHRYFSADATTASGETWLMSAWSSARLEAQRTPDRDFVLVFDEIQKIENWPELVKREWDADSFARRPIKLVLLGSSRALVMKGLSESLMGRYEEIRLTHWSFSEMRDAFDFTLEQYIFFGGYPGPSIFLPDERRWRDMVRAAMIDATINRDIFEDARIGKTALLRRTFELGVRYSGEILSLTKLLGELQGAGNVMTIAGYIEQLNACGLLGTLSKYANDEARKRASIPKFQVHNNALCAALGGRSFESVRADPALWGRVVESAVGAYLLNCAYRDRFDVMYWREGALEVDYVLRINGELVALEVKSNNEARATGLEVFCRKFSPKRAFIIGEAGLRLEDFFLMRPEALLA